MLVYCISVQYTSLCLYTVYLYTVYNILYIYIQYTVYLYTVNCILYYCILYMHTHTHIYTAWGCAHVVGHVIIYRYIMT